MPTCWPITLNLGHPFLGQRIELHGHHVQDPADGRLAQETGYGTYQDSRRVPHRFKRKTYLLLMLFTGWCGGHRWYQGRRVLAEDIKGIPTGPRPRPQALRGLSALLGLRLDACHFTLNLGHPFLGQRIELHGHHVAGDPVLLDGNPFDPAGDGFYGSVSGSGG